LAYEENGEDPSLLNEMVLHQAERPTPHNQANISKLLAHRPSMTVQKGKKGRDRLGRKRLSLLTKGPGRKGDLEGGVDQRRHHEQNEEDKTGSGPWVPYKKGELKMTVHLLENGRGGTLSAARPDLAEVVGRRGGTMPDYLAEDAGRKGKGWCAGSNWGGRRKGGRRTSFVNSEELEFRRVAARSC